MVQPEEEKKILIGSADACLGSGSGSGRNFILSKRGKFLSKAKIAYIQSSSVTSPYHPSMKLTDVERLLKNLRIKRYVLSDSLGST